MHHFVRLHRKTCSLVKVKISLLLFYIKNKSKAYKACSYGGYGGRTRTYEMPESESGALPTWLLRNIYSTH